MKKLSIIVAGEVHAGKSTLARAIAQLLPLGGIEPRQFTDSEALVQPSVEDQAAAVQTLREKILRKELEVEIVEVQHSSRFSEGVGINAVYQRGLLVSAIDTFLRQAGVLAKDAPELSGPEALYQLELYGEHLAQQKV